MPPLVPAPRRRFNVPIPLRDGVDLAADIAFPEVLPAPAVVMRTPYGKGGEVPSRRAEEFAAGGYVFVTADVRGRGTPGAPSSPTGTTARMAVT